jgi:hypothetical protein
VTGNGSGEPFRKQLLEEFDEWLPKCGWTPVIQHEERFGLCCIENRNIDSLILTR